MVVTITAADGFSWVSQNIQPTELGVKSLLSANQNLMIPTLILRVPSLVKTGPGSLVSRSLASTLLIQHIAGLVQDCSNSSALAMEYCSLALSHRYVTHERSHKEIIILH